MLNILVTGGTGKLGTELKKLLPDAEYVGSKIYDFIYQVPRKEYDLIVHMGAYTNTTMAEKEPQKCFLANAYGTYNVANIYKDTPIIYVSTEYAHKPLGVYAMSKMLGEEILKEHPKHLILRTALKPRPWPFEYAYEDQYTQGDYVDTIAALLYEKILSWDRETCGMEFLGTGRKTMLELARMTKPDVKPNKVSDYVSKTGAPIPLDYL